MGVSSRRMSTSPCDVCSMSLACWLAVLLVLCWSPMASWGQPATKRPSVFHYLTWTPQGVSNYSETNPLVVELEDHVILRCDRSGEFTYSNLVLQQHRSQYDQCNCMTSDLISCNSENRVGYCATELGQDIIIRIKGGDQTLSTAKTFSPGQVVYFISYANATNLVDSQRELFMGGDCTKGLKLVVMVANLRTQPPPTTTAPIPSTDSEDQPTVKSSPSDASPDQMKDPEGAATTDKDSKSSDHKPAAVVLTEELSSGSNLEDWHIGAIGVLVGFLVISLVVFMTVVIVLMVRRPTAVAPTTTTSGELGVVLTGNPDSHKELEARKEEEAYMSRDIDSPTDMDSPTDTVVKNEGAEPTSPTSTSITEYPSEFKDPLN